MFFFFVLFFLCRTTRIFSPISDGEFLAACLGVTVLFFVLKIKVTRGHVGSYDLSVRDMMQLYVKEF